MNYKSLEYYLRISDSFAFCKLVNADPIARSQLALFYKKNWETRIPLRLDIISEGDGFKWELEAAMIIGADDDIGYRVDPDGYLSSGEKVHPTIEAVLAAVPYSWLKLPVSLRISTAHLLDHSRAGAVG